MLLLLPLLPLHDCIFLPAERNAIKSWYTLGAFMSTWMRIICIVLVPFSSIHIHKQHSNVKISRVLVIRVLRSFNAMEFANYQQHLRKFADNCNHSHRHKSHNFEITYFSSTVVYHKLIQFMPFIKSTNFLLIFHLFTVHFENVANVHFRAP